jgi:hypothetical protein
MFRPWRRGALSPQIEDDDPTRWAWFVAALEHRELGRGALARKLGVPRYDLEEEARRAAWGPRLEAFDQAVAESFDAAAKRVRLAFLDAAGLIVAAVSESGGVGYSPRDAVALALASQKLGPVALEKPSASGDVDLSGATDEELEALSGAATLARKFVTG